MEDLIKSDPSCLNGRKHDDIYRDAIEEVKLINSLNSVEKFYGVVEPWAGMGIVYSHLNGWRKDLYRKFIMSGWFLMTQVGKKLYPKQWVPGDGDFTSIAKVTIYAYREGTTDCNDFKVVEKNLTWRNILKVYSK